MSDEKCRDVIGKEISFERENDEKICQTQGQYDIVSNKGRKEG